MPPAIAIWSELHGPDDPMIKLPPFGPTGSTTVLGAVWDGGEVEDGAEPAAGGPRGQALMDPGGRLGDARSRWTVTDDSRGLLVAPL